MSDELEEYCGLFGIFGDEDAAHLAALGIFALQHRGEESAGIVVRRGPELVARHGLGLVSEVFPAAELNKLTGDAAIGHCRYSTAGGVGLHNAQPFMVRYAAGQIAVAHNGTLVNGRTLRRRLEGTGSIFRSTSDTEVILHLIAQSKAATSVDRVIEAIGQIQGAYSLLLLTKDEMIGVRDPMGFRPLVLGRRQGRYLLASETCALDTIEAEYVREVEPGEVVVINENGVKSIRFAPEQKRIAPCVFEQIYFARPDSFVFGRDVYAVRKALGRELAKLHPIVADVVIPVPDSGVPAAIGYAEQSKIPFDMALTRSHYVGRSFIQSAQEIRAQSVRLKLATAGAALRGKRVVVVDDSLVRGTTSRKIVQLLRSAGAQEVHLRISAPPTISPCFYGIDMPTKGELLASHMSVEEIREYCGVDTIGYVDLDALRRASTYDQGQRCEACFTGDYPVLPTDLIEIGGHKVSEFSRSLSAPH